MSWLIYKHTNLINGKVYIGQTRQNTANRWGKDGTNYDTSFKFGKAIQKFGWENFSHEILEDNIPSQALANEREIFYIEFYDSYKHGYNMTLGGASVINDSRKIGIYQIDSNKTIVSHFASITEASKSLSISAQNIGACLLGHQLTCKGYYFLKDTIDVANFVLPTSKYKRPIICVETNNVYDSAISASKITGISYTQILINCARQAIKAGNFTFAYLDEYDDSWNPVLPKERDFEWRKKHIICVETGEIWDSLTDCSIETGISVQNLSQNCCISHKSCKNKHFAYLNQYSDDWKPAEKYDTLKRKRVSSLKKEVYCLQTDTIYDSVSTCSQALGIPVRSIARCAQKDSDLISTHGYNFCYKSDWYIGWKPRESQKDKTTVKAIRCLETGETFPSMKAAIDKYHLNASSLTTCCKGRRATAGGFHWKYVEKEKNKEVQYDPQS